MKKLIFFCILKVTEYFGTDPHLHPDQLVRVTDRGSGSVPKCHGSRTLLKVIKTSGCSDKIDYKWRPLLRV
jgi:hypothetical protein